MPLPSIAVSIAISWPACRPDPGKLNTGLTAFQYTRSSPDLYCVRTVAGHQDTARWALDVATRQPAGRSVRTSHGRVGLGWPSWAPKRAIMALSARSTPRNADTWSGGWPAPPRSTPGRTGAFLDDAQLIRPSLALTSSRA